jgi:hypothetical protein
MEILMNLIQQLEKEQFEKLSASKKIPDFGPGDTLIVNVKVVEGERTRVQAYEGVCIGRSGGGLNESFTVRKISYGEVGPHRREDRARQGRRRVIRHAHRPIMSIGGRKPPFQSCILDGSGARRAVDA